MGSEVEDQEDEGSVDSAQKLHINNDDNINIDPVYPCSSILYLNTTTRYPVGAISKTMNGGQVID